MITEITDNSRPCLVPDEYNLPEEGVVYICAGKDFDAEVLDSPHFIGEGYEEAENLYRASLVDDEACVEGTGYYCGDCLQKMGFTTEGRETLAGQIEFDKERKRRAAGTKLDQTIESMRQNENWVRGARSFLRDYTHDVIGLIRAVESGDSWQSDYYISKLKSLLTNNDYIQVHE